MRHSCRRVPGWHIHELILCGRWHQACTLWCSVFEVVHLGVNPAMPVVQSVDLPPLRRMPCCQNPCFRCENRRLGVKTGGVGFSSFHRYLDPQSCFASMGRPQWQLAQSDNATLDLVAAAMHSSGLEAADFKDCRSRPASAHGLRSASMKKAGSAQIGLPNLHRRHWLNM